MQNFEDSTFGIYQICYKPELRKFLDPAFIPYENFENERPEWREFHVFRKEWLAGTMDKHTYTGFISWKFREKARIKGKALLDFARANPGADCYFINPFPNEVVRFPNMWLQGEHCHPGLIEATENILRKIDSPRRLTATVHTNDIACYCNFWFATQPFWEAYMDFCLPIYDYIERRASQEEKAILWARADRNTDAPMIPYIFERLFTEFLLTDPGFEIRGFRYSEKHLNSRFHKRFAEVYRGADALKRGLRRNPDVDLVLGMRDFSQATALLYKVGPRKHRQKPRKILKDTLKRLTRKPRPVLKP